MSSRKQFLLPLPPPPSSAPGRGLKRRRLRKGTLSCWECKRRKTKCILVNSSTDGVCNDCQRRGVPCVSQEFPDDVSSTKQHIGDRLGRVERLVSQLTEKTESTSEQAPDGHGTRATFDRKATIAQPALRYHHVGHAPTTGTHDALTKTLLAAWPSPDDLEVILGTLVTSSGAFHGVVCMPYAQFKAQRLPSPRELLQPPSTETHPVTIARKLLILASLLQNLGPAAAQHFANRLSTNQQTMMSRAVETAGRLVNNDDEFASTMEGLECIMMESMHHNNAGNLRRAYITMRRALALAQTLGLERDKPSPLLRMLDPGSRERLSPEHMWFRIVQSDRYLSLMLGLPHGSFDDAFAAPEVLEACAPLESLERVLTMVGGRIIQRTKSKMLDLDETLKIDKVLLEAAALMPPRWWLLVNRAGLDENGTEGIDATLSMTIQLAYFHVLGRLHFPHLLQSSDDRRYDYSRMTAITASRELLLRFLAFRGSGQGAGTYCRGIDFLAFIASTALCIGHMHSCARYYVESSDAQGNDKTVPNALAHQRLADRGHLEEVLGIMDEAGTSEPGDLIAGRITVILRQLLAIEADVARGGRYRAAATDEHDGGELGCHGAASNDGRSLIVSLPHLGAIKIERQMTRCGEVQHSKEGLSCGSNDDLRGEEQRGVDFDLPMPAPGHGESVGVLPDDGTGEVFGLDMEADWVLQGVDVALFDSFCWETIDEA